MIVYLAGEHDVKNGKSCQTWKGLNILESYIYARANKHFPRLARTSGNLMLDSGAFTLRKGNDNVDWEKYVCEYAEFINEHKIRLFLELDIDNIIGLKRVESLRALLENRTGNQCIPVWHPSRGKDYFLSMCKDYSYVALGGIVNANISKKEYKMHFPWFIAEAHKQGAKIHGLGFTTIPMLKTCKFDSVDSKAWISGNLGGIVYRYNNGDMEKYTKKQCRLKSALVAQHNFNEWVKFSNYAQLYL